MRRLLTILGVAVVGWSAYSSPAASATSGATTARQSNLYLVSTSESDAAGVMSREWFLSDGSREREEVLMPSTGATQVEEGQEFSIDSDLSTIATLMLNFVTIGPGATGESTPGKTWSLQTTEDVCQAVCADGGSGLFFGPKAIQFSMSSHYASTMRTAACAVQGGCPQFRVIDKSARFRGQSVFELQETEPGGCTFTLTSQSNCTAFVDYWVTKGSDMMLETVHGTIGSTKTTVQTYHWAKLTTTNCNDLAVTIPSGFTRLPVSNQSEFVRNVWPMLDCSNLAGM